MSTRSERFKADAQRTGAAAKSKPKPPTSKKRSKRPAAEANGSAEKKAAYARDTTEATEKPAQPARPSRKSTRKSANHAKTDTGEMRAQQMRENTPEAKAARSKAHSKGRIPGKR